MTELELEIWWYGSPKGSPQPHCRRHRLGGSTMNALRLASRLAPRAFSRANVSTLPRISSSE